MEIGPQDFKRGSPAKFSERAGLPAGWTVLRFSHLPDKDKRRATHGRAARTAREFCFQN